MVAFAAAGNRPNPFGGPISLLWVTGVCTLRIEWGYPEYGGDRVQRADFVFPAGVSVLPGVLLPWPCALMLTAGPGTVIAWPDPLFPLSVADDPAG